MTVFDQLNPEQRHAAATIEGPLLVIAGAGSGKTRVVTSRIAYLLEKGVPANKILGLTFTNKAAREMKERVHNMTQSEVLICTFHSLGARILRESIHRLGYQRDFIIYDEDDIDKLLKTCLDTTLGSKQELRALRNLISLTKNGLLPPSQKTSSLTSIFELYQAKLREYNAVDYDDLLCLPVKLFKEHPDVLEYYQQRWSFMLIDEYQDTNNMQYDMVQLLVAKHGNLCVVGDPDQSIYSWRGANLNNILNFESDFPGAIVVRLDQNYRSRSNILDAANVLIANNYSRYEKKLWSNRGPGEKIKIYRADNERSEATYISQQIAYHHREHEIPLNQMVVFYRTNAQSRPFEDCFLQCHIPYTIVGGISFYQRREIKDILAWLRMIHNGSDFISFSRTINIPKRGLGDTTIEKISVESSKCGTSIFEYCERLISGQTLEAPVKLSAKQKNGLTEYVQIIHSLRQMSAQVPLSDLIKLVIEQSRYKEYLEEDRETEQDRLENLSALIAKACEWEEATASKSLEAFLEELSLKSSLDDADGNKEHVSLMTIHNGKGLEFEVTFLAGMEEELFPHINARETHEGLEEERRLCYVGMTRAKEYLYLTHASTRTLWGATRMQRASRFLSEIPREYVEKIGHTATSSSSYRPTNQYRMAADPTKAFNVGDIVFHQDFGVGRIQDVSQEHVGLTYRIFFSKEQAEKTLVAQFTTLTRL